MSSLPNVLFIINPVSGVGKKEGIPELIQTILASHFNVKIVYTEGPKHAIELSKQAVKENYHAVFAVGGDGSVNEVAQGLVHSKVRLGIIPVGSGNGLARHLNIPLNPEKAIKALLSKHYTVIDAGKINNHFFVGTAGVGFDARIAEKFWKLKNRGFINYVKTVVREFKSYIPPVFNIIIDGKTEQRKAFILSIANSSQYGNQASIAPGAHAGDGFLELCSIDEFPTIKASLVATRLLTGTLNGASYYHRKIVEKVSVTGNFNWFHVDGEPFECDGKIDVEVIPSALKVITALNF